MYVPKAELPRGWHPCGLHAVSVTPNIHRHHPRPSHRRSVAVALSSLSSLSHQGQGPITKYTALVLPKTHGLRPRPPLLN